MSALARAAEFFVAPAAERAPARAAALPEPSAIAVLGPLRDALPVAATLGTLIAVWDPSPPHVVAAEPPQRAAGPLATPTATRLARWANDRGHDAIARGRTVRVALSAEPRHASAEASRLAASTDARLVTVFAGPRDAAHDALLAEQDRIVVVTRQETDPDLVSLTLAGLGPHAIAVPALTGPVRVAASAGWLRRDLARFAVPA